MKNIKLPPLQVDFLRLCSCQVSSYLENFIEIFQSLMSQVEGKTPISDHRKGTVLFNKGVWAMLGGRIREVPSVTPPPLTHPPPPQEKRIEIQIFRNAILKI